MLGASALGFALLLKHYSHVGRFPRGRSDLSDAVIEFVARQVGVDASDPGFYEWSGRTIEYHRNQIRGHLGLRVATISDQEKLTAWLASNVAHAERRPERVRDELLAEFRAERIEPPTAGRVLRMLRSTLRTAEHSLGTAVTAGQVGELVNSALPAPAASWLHGRGPKISAQSVDLPITRRNSKLSHR